MANNIIPSDREIKGLDLNQNELRDLVRQAEESDALDRKLTIRQALKQYKAATFWAEKTVSGLMTSVAQPAVIPMSKSSSS